MLVLPCLGWQGALDAGGRDLRCSLGMGRWHGLVVLEFLRVYSASFSNKRLGLASLCQVPWDLVVTI